MKTIFKTNNTDANAIIDPYLALAKNESWYGINCGDRLYEEFKRKDNNGDNRRDLIIDQVLLPEQDNHCCYCMRRIDNHADNATIEHIVPESVVSASQINHYFSARSAGLNSGNVCLTNDYVNNGSVPPPYPHHVAYHNYTVACKDCNSNRSNEVIEPLFLFPGIESEVVYDSLTGEVNWPNDPVYSNSQSLSRPTLEKIDLNRPLLKAIRAVWFYAKREGIIPSMDNRNDLISGAFGEVYSHSVSMKDEDFRAYLNLFTEEMWKRALKYSYFG